MLTHLAVFSVQGPDAGTFLQGQLTQDVLSQSSNEARAGGYCSPKGRLLANFVILHPEPEAWWFVTAAELVPAVVKRLKMFVLRAQCTVTPRDDLVVQGLQAADLAPWSVRPDGASAPALRAGWFGGRALWVGPAAAILPTGPSDTSAPNLSAEAWRWADIQAGWPWIEAATVEQFVPQMVNFEVLGGVNFRKGCYPGQEVVARSQYRGTLKRRMALYTVEGASPAAGAEVFDVEDPAQPAGMVVNAAADPASPSRIGLLVEVKLAAQEAPERLRLGSAGGPALTPIPLPYRLPTESER